MKKVTLISIGLLAVAGLLLMGAGEAAAQNYVRVSTDMDTTGILTNNWAAHTRPRQVFNVTAYNSSGSTVYLMIWDSATNRLANEVPGFAPLPIPANSTGSIDWGPAGCPFWYGFNAAVSTTPLTLTNASAVALISVVSGPK